MTAASEGEARHLAAPPAQGVEVIEAPSVPSVVVRAADVPMSGIRELFDSAFTALFPALAERGIQPAGPPYSLYHRMPSDTIDLEIGIPVASPLDGEVVTPSGVVLVPSSLPAGRVARTTHLGSYEGLADAWSAFMGALAERGEAPGLPFWEVYVTEPTPDGDPAALRTDLCMLVGR